MTDTTRPPISRRLRFEILRRDGNTCRYCGGSAPDVKLTVDHVIPVALGGGDEPSNLVTACQPCNAGKSSISPDAELVADVDATALLFAKAAERAAELRRADRIAIETQLAQFEAIWNRWHYNSDATKTVERDADWRISVTRFLSLGLTVQDMALFVDETMTTKGVMYEFKLFCKKCWNEIGARQELARQLIEDGKV